jgi:hypothetical protein
MKLTLNKTFAQTKKARIPADLNYSFCIHPSSFKKSPTLVVCDMIL